MQSKIGRSARPLALLLTLGVAGCTPYQKVGTPKMSAFRAGAYCGWKWGHTPAGIRQSDSVLLGAAIGGAAGGAITGITADPPMTEAEFDRACMRREGWIVPK